MNDPERIVTIRPKWHVATRPDATIHYLDSGSAARRVAQLYSLAGHAWEWLGMMRRLHLRWRTLAVDLRGHGRSTRIPSNRSREAFAADVAAIISAAAGD